MNRRGVPLLVLAGAALIGAAALLIKEARTPLPEIYQSIEANRKVRAEKELPYQWAVYPTQSNFFGRKDLLITLSIQAPKYISLDQTTTTASIIETFKGGVRKVYFHPGFALRHEGGEAEAWITFSDSPVPMRLALVPDETYYSLRIKDGEGFLSRAAKASSMTIRYQPLRAEKPFEVEFPLGPMPKALARFEEMAKQGSAS